MPPPWLVFLLAWPAGAVVVAVVIGAYLRALDRREQRRRR